MITEENDQSNSNGQLNLRFIQWIIAPWKAFYWVKSSKEDMIKQCGLHFGQGHISVVRWQSLLCQEGMGNQWNWPVQASVPIGWLRSLSGKIWLSRVHRKLWKVLRDIFNWMEIWHINIAPRLQYSISYAANATEKPDVKVLHKSRACTSRSKIEIWQCVESDQLYLLCLAALRGCCCH